MKHLSRDHHIYALDPAGAPAITIGSGEALMKMMLSRAALEQLG